MVFFVPSNPITTDSSYFTCIPMAIFNAANLTANFQSLNGTGFAQDIKCLKIWNNSNALFIVSYDDGITEEDVFPPNSQFVFDIQTNHESESAYGQGTLYGRRGQMVFGKGTPGVGNLYIVGYR